MDNISMMLYGISGGGKTGTGLSGFWDFKQRELIKGTVGRWLRVGVERNSAIAPPADKIKHIPAEKNPALITQKVEEYLGALTKGVQNGEFEKKNGKLTHLLFDGFTELAAQRTAREGSESNKWDTFKAWKESYLNLVQLLDPGELGLDCHVISTARIGEAKKGQTIRGEDQAGDPEWLEAMGLIPEVDGWARKHLPNAFEYVFYVSKERVKEVVKGKSTSRVVARIHMQSEGEYLVKNQFDHCWFEAGLPNYIDNPTFQDILDLMDKAQAYRPKKKA